ncbi:hypothetical protein OS493_029894 [Desmophyllum pertusum]|uniref:Uncharacterized protein n=1 Tax=Desmophyllum pertusum TaxID=174260 RepID=A0A9W9YAA9_9CNID|nr:hypothetical protein OS493_029894 [Desmophyllum pertusum]
MIAKLFLFWLSLARLSLEQLFSHFDLYDAIHILFLGALGICLRLVEQGEWSTNKKVRSSLRSLCTPVGKKRGSVSFAAGTKFYPIQSYNPLNWTILRNVSSMSTMSETWKAQRSSLKISLTTDDGDEVTEGDGSDIAVSRRL